MQIGDRFRNGGDGGGFGLWRRERSCGRSSGECKDSGSIDKSRSGTVSNQRLPPDRIGGEGSVQIMKQNRGSKVEAYGRIGIPPQEIMSTPNRLRGQPKKSNQTHVNSLLDEEIPKPAVPSKRHSTSIIARLMGLDPVLPPQPLNQEFKDVFEVRQTEKAERKNLVSQKGFKKSTQRDADEAKRVSTGEDLRRSHEFGEALDLDSRRDLLLKFLEEPNSLFKSQRKDLPEAKITILKSCVGERSKSKFDHRDDPGSLPTRIVVLKPSLHRVDQKPAESTRTSVDRQLSNERRTRESRRSGRREALYELRESDGTHKARRSREIAREVTRHMKQAAEMQMMAHKGREPICPRGCSTLGEMLAFADVETSEMPSGSSPQSLHERIPEKKKIPGGSLKRSKSVPSSSAINGNLNSFKRPGVDLQDLPKRGSRPLDSVKEVHVDYDRPPDNALTVEKSCSSSSAVEKYCTVDAERKAGSKEISSITEEADQPSPISVLETHSESGSPPEESFERLSADLRELRLKLQLLKCESADAGSDTMISSDEDGDEREEEEGDPNREFDYLEKTLAEAGFRRGDWDEFFCGFFAPEAPICRDVFEKLEKTCYGEDSWRKSQRKLLFDTINVVLADILAMNMELRPWVKKNCRADRRKSLVEETWELMCRRRREAVASGPNKFLEDPKWLDVIDDVDAIGREVERMIEDDLLQELVFDVFSRAFDESDSELPRGLKSRERTPARRIFRKFFIPMAPFLFRGLKRVSISCTSPASTRTNYGGLGFPLQKNYSPLKSRKSPSCSSRYLLDVEEDDGLLFDSDEDLVPQLTRIKSARFQIVTGEDSALLKPSPFSAQRYKILNGASSSSLSSPPSTRFKITRGEEREDENVINSSSLEGIFRSSSSPSKTRFISPVEKESTVLTPSFSSRAQEQVVILRVSLHCKACEAKVKKHLSRMEGVRSFDVDFAAKKVTVVGNVTPLSLLSRVSKVKNAELWTSHSPSLALV